MQDKVLKILEYNKIIDMLVEKCSTDLGVKIASTLTPETSLATIQHNLKETSQAFKFFIKKGAPSFSGASNTDESLNKVLKGAILNIGEIHTIGELLRASKNIKAYFTSNIERQIAEEVDQIYNILSPLFRNIYTNPRVEQRIFECIISDAEISDNASPALRSIRRQIIDIEQDIKDRLNKMIHSTHYQKFLQESFVTVRAGRYVLPVKQEFKNEIQGLVHDSSASGATLFIEPLVLVEANNNIKQLKIKEALEIDRILAELSANIADIAEQLIENLSLIQRLDFAFAKASLCYDMNAIEPELVTNGHLQIKKGRHPLLDKKIVVPIDVWFNDKFNTLVITGPNTGGKTVTLKTVGLLTLMAQAGLHIPAGDGSVINIFDDIFADIGDEQSIEQNLSTFSSHMKNIVHILDKVNQNSLVLLDELGSGTDPVEGSAIAMSVLEYLNNTGAVTVATTHYSELKLFAIDHEGIENASCEFDTETLMPTYKLLIGIPGRSNAFAITQKLGLQDIVLQRAKEFLTSENTKFEDILGTVESTRIATENKLLEIENLRAECIALKSSLEAQKEKLDANKNSLIREAKQEAKELIKEAKLEAEEILAEMRKHADDVSHESRKKSEELQLKLKKRQNELEKSVNSPILEVNNAPALTHVNAGDNVFVSSVKQNGVVIAHDDANNVTVQVGIIKIKVPLSQLSTPIKSNKKQEAVLERASYKDITSNKDRTTSMELDIRGQNLLDALDNVDKYLDNVYLSGLKNVTIIHGKGTGVLRKGIHDFLKKHPNVRTFRLGVFGEGEHGVTIVELK